MSHNSVIFNNEQLSSVEIYIRYVTLWINYYSKTENALIFQKSDFRGSAFWFVMAWWDLKMIPYLNVLSLSYHKIQRRYLYYHPFSKKAMNY